MGALLGLVWVLLTLVLYSVLRMLRRWDLRRSKLEMPKLTDDEAQYMENRTYGNVISDQSPPPKTNGRRRRRWEEHFGSRRHL